MFKRPFFGIIVLNCGFGLLKKEIENLFTYTVLEDQIFINTFEAIKKTDG